VEKIQKAQNGILLVDGMVGHYAQAVREKPHPERCRGIEYGKRQTENESTLKFSQWIPEQKDNLWKYHWTYSKGNEKGNAEIIMPQRTKWHLVGGRHYGSI
jgi:hypothetical protein